MLGLILSALLSVSYVVDKADAPMLAPTAGIVEPVIITVTDFDEDSAKAFARDVQRALNSGQTILPIVISSYGGSIYAFLEMADIIKSVNMPVATICVGKCMSAGAMLLAMGTDGYRYAAPNSTILLHDAATMMRGKLKDLQNEAAEITRLNDLIFSMMDKQSKRPPGYYQKILDTKGHIDWFMTADEAKGHGIVNFVRIPKLKLKITTRITLE